MNRTARSALCGTLLITLGVMAWPLPARAVPEADPDPEDAIVTDRPDVAESSLTVGRLHLQFELGLDVERDAHEGVRTFSFRTPLKVRFGVTEWAEVHIETDGIGYDNVSAGRASNGEAGMTDLDVGGKVHLFDQVGARPSCGLLLALALPIGKNALAPADAFVLLPTLAADWDLPADFSIGLNVGSSIALSQREREPDVLRYALSFGRSWAPLAPTLRSYVELFGDTAFEDGTTALGMDGGFTWLARPNLQLDLTARGGLTEEAPDIGGALGFSIRI